MQNFFRKVTNYASFKRVMVLQKLTLKKNILSGITIVKMPKITLF